MNKDNNSLRSSRRPPKTINVQYGWTDAQIKEQEAANAKSRQRREAEKLAVLARRKKTTSITKVMSTSPKMGDIVEGAAASTGAVSKTPNSTHPQSSLSSRTPFLAPKTAKQERIRGDRNLSNEQEQREQRSEGSQRETLGGTAGLTSNVSYDHNVSETNRRMSTVEGSLSGAQEEVIPRVSRMVPQLDLEGDGEGAGSPSAFNNYDPPDPYATNNPPLLMMDNMADTIAEHPLRDTDWSDILTGKRDLLFYDSRVVRAREDLTISKNFTGDVAYWPEFKAVVHSNINLKRYLNWGEKCSLLIKYLGYPALEHCDWSDRTREGYIMALHTLEREFGGFDKLESALYTKLGSIPKISSDPQSLHAPKMILRQILKINSAVGCTRNDKLKAERLFFDRLRWQTPEENAFLQFLMARGASQETAALFKDWAGGTQKLFRARLARTGIEDSANKQKPKTDKVLTVAETTHAKSKGYDFSTDTPESSDGEADYVFAIGEGERQHRRKIMCFDFKGPHIVTECPKYEAQDKDDRVNKCYD
jgi:hypothetical protein